MSTSPVIETTQPTGEDPFSAQAANCSIETKVTISDQNTSMEPQAGSNEQNILIEPKLAPPGEQISETKVMPSVEQNTSVQEVGEQTVLIRGQNISTEQKEISKSEENSIDKKLPEVDKNDKVSENETTKRKIGLVEDAIVIENKPEVKNPGQEPASGSVASEFKNISKTTNIFYIYNDIAQCYFV